MEKSILNALENLEKIMDEKKSSKVSPNDEPKPVHRPPQHQEPNYIHGHLDIKPFPIEYRYILIDNEEYIVLEDISKDDSDEFVYGQVHWEISYIHPSFPHRGYALGPYIMAVIEYANALHYQITSQTSSEGFIPGHVAYEGLLNMKYKPIVHSLWELWQGYDLQEEIVQLTRRYRGRCYIHPKDMAELNHGNKFIDVYGMLNLASDALDGEKQYIQFINHDYFTDQSKIIFIHHDLFLYLLYLKHPTWKEEIMRHLYHQPIPTELTCDLNYMKIIDKLEHMQEEHKKEIKALKEEHEQKLKSLASKIERLEYSLDQSERRAMAYRKLYRMNVDDGFKF